MASLIAVDPGLKGCGVAHFRDGLLDGAAYVPNPRWQAGGGPDVWRGMAGAVAGAFYTQLLDLTRVVELPQVYAGRKQVGDPEDLIQLAGLVGWLRPDVLVRPSQWKGQLPKPGRKSETYLVESRVRERLTPAELTRLPAKTGPAWDAIDAVGIGLYHLGRFTPRRVIAR